jgi:NAD(P)-dependent dehydrogenase (short-subunit alcohol dehydrogenase family)
MHLKILVTGGAKGLGKEICTELAKRGHSLMIHYRSSQKDAQIVQKECQELGVEAEIIHGDFSRMDSLLHFLEKLKEIFPNVKGVVNNVGNYFMASIAQTTREQWEEIFQTNVSAPFEITKSLIPNLKKNQGSIVNIGTAGLHALRANLYCSAYSMTKLTFWYMTLNFAKELAPFGINVNMVSPGVMENTVDLEEGGHYIPMKRFANLNEVARAVTYFFENENKYITGQNLEVSGGFAL